MESLRKDKKPKKRSKSRERDTKKVKSRRRSRSSSDEERRSKIDEKSKKRRQVENEEKEADKTEKTELSIEETNKLRAQLGLKPLQLNDEKQNKESVSVQGNQIYHDQKTDETFEHVPAKNISDFKHEKKLRDKLDEQKDKRTLQDKFLSTKKLGDSDEDEDAQAWVNKLKIKQREEAEKKAKSLQEMDELALSEVTEKPKKDKVYTAKDLKGLKVEHSQEHFKEEREVILTLKDKNVLDENDDVLINVNIVDEENAEKNVENKKKKPVYRPFDEFDEFGNFIDKSVLDKYDDEEKKKSFELGAGGSYDSKMDRFIEQQNNEFKSRAIKLDLQEFKIANDYLTKEEQEAFKKPKKMKKKLRKAIKASDLLPLDDEDVNLEKQGENLGTRVKTEDGEITTKEKLPNVVTLKGIDFNFKQNIDEDEDNNEDREEFKEDYSDLNVNDDALDELHTTLYKIRNKVIKNKMSEITDLLIADREKEDEENGALVDHMIDEDVDEEGSKQITLDSMTEFCRNVGGNASAKYKKKYNVQEDEINVAVGEKKNVEEEEDEFVEQMEYDEEEEEADDDENEDENRKHKEIDENAAILDDEPIVDRGLASAIKLAINKGYLEQEKKVQNARVKENISAVHIMVEDKNHYEIDDKYSRNNRDRERFMGPTSEFKEKEGYKPEVKLEYPDEKGHRMNKKEAFRFLSHRFHGKGPGKLKTEKRANKIKEHELMNKMSSIDTPLNTLNLLVEKQKKLKQAFVVLSAPKGGKNEQIPLNKR